MSSTTGPLSEVAVDVDGTVTVAGRHAGFIERGTAGYYEAWDGHPSRIAYVPGCDEAIRCVADAYTHEVTPSGG